MMNEQLNILVMATNPEVAETYAKLLDSYGKVDVVYSDENAIELIDSKNYHLLLLERSPNNNIGLDVLIYLNQENKTITTLVTTYKATLDLVKTCMHYKVRDIIENPFNMEKKLAIIKESAEFAVTKNNFDKLASMGLNAAELLHEINNPLTSIALSVELLENGIGTANTIKNLSNSVDKATKLIKRTKSRLRENGSTILSRIQLGEVLDSAALDFQPRAHKNAITVTVPYITDIFIAGDAGALTQIIVNLVNNSIDAISHLEEKWIKIEVIANPDNVDIMITDSGKGIAKDIQNKLFNPLFTTKGIKGSGLGLGISRKIAIEHKGSLFLVPLSPNTQFCLNLPRITKP